MKETTNKIPRNPVVVIMGHIDHGKSTLLDYIRKASTTEKEAGGITQHVAAYEAGNITFLDTPGHAAFTAIRERGSKTADIAVLVVSAEDGVKPQTKEAIDWIKKSGIPYLVAINKIDKPNANPEKTKTELGEVEVFVEGWGGTVPCLLISAKTGEGIPDLLETLALQAEIDGLSYDPTLKASGFVIESKRDAKRGISATLLIKEGSLKKGDYIRSGNALAPIRIIEDFTGKAIDESNAGKPIVLTGWGEVPPVGAEFYTYDSKLSAEKSIEEPQGASLGKLGTKEAPWGSETSTKKMVPVIIKADTVGSLEAIVHETKKLETEKIGLKVISFGVGPITEADAKLGKAFPEIIILGFNTKTEASAGDMIVRDNLKTKTFNIIYELSAWLELEMKERTPKEEVDEVTGKANIIKIFSVNRSKQVVGGKVEEGTIEVNAQVKIIRREIEIGDGYIRELQSKKVKTSSVEAGTDFGAMIESKIGIAPTDKILCIKRVVR